MPAYTKFNSKQAVANAARAWRGSTMAVQVTRISSKSASRRTQLMPREVLSGLSFRGAFGFRDGSCTLISSSSCFIDAIDVFIIE